jgi:hypothetical protein
MYQFDEIIKKKEFRTDRLNPNINIIVKVNDNDAKIIPSF